jgi:HK97 family phage portal protein
MGFFKDLFKTKSTSTTNNKVHADMFIDGSIPLYANERGEYIFYDDVVNCAINCVVNEIKKVKLHHVKEVNGIYQEVNGNYQYILNKPNRYMSLTDFLSVIVWQYFKNGNVYIYPIYQNNKLTELIPLDPANVEFTENPNDGEPYITFYFQDGTKSPAVPYNLIIHIRKDYRGSGYVGNSNNQYLSNLIKLNDNVQQNIVNASAAPIQGILQYDHILDPKLADEARLRFENALRKQTAGILTIEGGATFTQLNSNNKLVDADTLAFIDNKILRNFGVSLAFLNSDYTPQQYQAIYNKTIEPILATFSDAFTNGLFSNEARINGNKIIFSLTDASKLFMTDEAKISFSTLSGQIGLLTRNELRSLFYYPPLAGPEGNVIPMNNAFSNASDNTKKEADKNAKEQIE